MDEIKTSKESKEKEQEVFITDITIHKVRHLENIHIPLSKNERKHLILTGKNGSGKTSVLESLRDHFYIENLFTIDSLEPKRYRIRYVITPAEQRRGEGYVKNKIAKVEFNLPLKKRKALSSKFLVAYYETKRKIKMEVPKGLKKIDLRGQYDIEERPGDDFIQYIVNLKADKSFARDDQDHETVKNIEKWFEMFENSLKEIFEDPSLRLEFDRKNFNYKILQGGKEPFDFNTLADGYSAIINMVTDLILRMERHKTKSYDVQGLVLIDELETHLHIDLQKKVFPFLTRFFPRIQFIVTTHSPFILSSIDNAIIYDLENNLLVNDLSGYSYDGIIEAYFYNDLYSDSAKKDLETYERLVNQEKRTEEEEERMMDLRIELENIPDSLAPELKVRFQQIELKRIKQHP